MKNKVLNIIAAFLMLMITQLGFSINPSLGTAADFVLFSTNGAVTNNGVTFNTLLTGNVGANNGSISGFGNVNGVMHFNDGVTAAAAADLLTAYNLLSVAIPDYEHAILLGSETLVPGTYNLPAQSTLDGILTLDGQGNANAEFIIKIGGSFSTTALSEVVLINDAKACNVFWKIEGLIELGTGSTMKGNLIANNAAIVFGEGVSLEGRAFSTTGAITAYATTAYTPIGCGSPILNGPAAPDLKTTSCYAIFSGNGNVTNAGITHLIGDVGTNVTLTTGFDALNVDGIIHEIADVSTAQAAADLIEVHTHLNNLTTDIELLYPAEFGHYLELTPHTYLLDGATVLTDTIFLNALGNSNAVFVIKITGALSTNVASSIILENGAQAKNVYWVVGGAVHIESNSNFKGNIVVNNAAISINGGTVLNGRVLTTDGAIAVEAVTVTIPSPCVDPVTSLLNPTNNKIATVQTNYSGQELEIQLLENQNSHTTQLYIYNSVGRLMASKQITQSKTIISSNYPTGIYFYKLTSNESSQKAKFIVK